MVRLVRYGAVGGGGCIGLCGLNDELTMATADDCWHAAANHPPLAVAVAEREGCRIDSRLDLMPERQYPLSFSALASSFV